MKNYDGGYKFDGKKLYFWSVGLTPDYVKQAEFDKAYEMVKKHPPKALYRHRSNVTKEGEVHGYVTDAELSPDGKQIFLHFELDAVTDEDKRVINEIVGSITLARQTGDKPYGVSFNFENFFEVGDDSQTPRKLHVEEVSVTPKPQCDECRIVMEKKVGKMPEDNKDIFATAIVNKSKELEKEVEAKKAVLEEVSEEFAKVKVALEAASKEKADLVAKNIELEAKVTKLEAEWKQKYEMLEKKPLLDEIAKIDPAVVELIKDKPVDKLTAYLDQKKKEKNTPTPGAPAPSIAPQIQVKTLEESVKKSKTEFEKKMEAMEKAVDTGLRSWGKMEQVK